MESINKHPFPNYLILSKGTYGLGSFSQARADKIVALAQASGEEFVPSFEYTTIFGEQVTGQMAVIFVPDSNGDGLPDNQIVIGEVKLAQLGDRVWLDADADGIQDAGENGIAGVTVNLLADVDGDGEIEEGEVIDTTTTDADGNYEFEVIAGDYKVEFEQPEGFDSFSPRQQGGDPTLDSDGLISDVVRLNPGENDPTIDAGFYNTVGLGDFVFEDNNGNGIQDAGEGGVAGVEVKLQNPDGTPVTDEAGNPITTITDGTGFYSFEGLNPGEYKVMFVAPEGFEFTLPNQGDDDSKDSDADPENGMTQTITLESGEFNGTLDAGLIQPTPGIDIEKSTNGFDADTPDAAVEIIAGQTVTWTYEVTNTGNVAFAEDDIVVNDNQEGLITNIVDKGDGDNLLSAGETWIYEKTGIAQNLTGSAGETTTFHLTGTSHLDGPNGNIRTFHAGDLSVKTSAFSRDAHGTWEKAFLGSFSTGLGVTDNSEGDGSNGLHKVDNVHRDNYVLFKFSENVVVDRTFLASVSHDSDITYWVGTVENGLDNLHLSDAFLNSLEFSEDNNTHSSYARWADINNGEVAGNILVIAASTSDAHPDDRFKIKELEVQGVEGGIYQNIGTVHALGAKDADFSHYVNPTPAPGIDIEKFVNGIDASSPDEYPELTPGDHVTFTYHVTNTGNVPFDGHDVVVTDDNGTADDIYDDFKPGQVLDGHFNVGDSNQNNTLDAGETWKYTKTLTVQDLFTSDKIHIEAEDMHLSMVYVGGDDDDDDGGGYYNGYVREHNSYASGDDLIKVTGHYGTASTKFYGEDGDYDVVIAYWDENDGHSTMDFKHNGHSISHWTWDKELGSNVADDKSFTTHKVENISLKYGDSLSLKGTFNGGEYGRVDYIELIKKGGTEGIYENVATVEAGTVSDSDTSGYTNPIPEPENPSIDIEKFVNGIDASGPDEYPELKPGDHVTFTYHVTNTGNVPFDGHDVVVTDDNGTADDIYDDFKPYQVLDGHFNVGDSNQNNTLDAGETWKYSKTLTVEDLSASHKIRMEAEDFHLAPISSGDDDDDYISGYVREHNSYASGDDLIKLSGHYGTASTKFHGETGHYDVLIGYYDENDGHSTMDFKRNGHSVDHWTWDKELGSHLPDDKTFTTHKVEHLYLEYGDKLSFKGTMNGGEYARVDYIELIEKNDTAGIYENVATVKAGDVFDTDISGYINPVDTVV